MVVVAILTLFVDTLVIIILIFVDLQIFQLRGGVILKYLFRTHKIKMVLNHKPAASLCSVIFLGS